MATLRERYREALRLMGAVEVPRRSRRYFVYRRPDGMFYYVGRQGALRFGPTIARSWPASDLIKHSLLESVPVVAKPDKVKLIPIRKIVL